MIPGRIAGRIKCSRVNSLENPSVIALEMGSIEYGSLHLSVLYVANAVLLVILFIVLGISYLLKRRLATHEN